MKTLLFLTLFCLHLVYSQESDEYFITKTDVSRCFAGELKENVKQDVLEYINMIRTIHGLDQVSYDNKKQHIVQEAALCIVANEKLNHQISKDYKCYSTEAFWGSSSSNLSIAHNIKITPRSQVDGWMQDVGVPSLGHRRWILHPFLSYVTYGRAEAMHGWLVGGVLYVIHNETRKDISHLKIEYVAYPYKKYPKELFYENCFLSFSVFDKHKTESKTSEEVDFSQAKIEMFDQQRKIKVHSISFNYECFGLCNVLRWKMSDFQYGVNYTVSIKNIKIGNEIKNYEYQFLVDN